jgi:squalene-hopene/tetraprenyl-beta-curcumene cyclase
VRGFSDALLVTDPAADSVTDSMLRGCAWLIEHTQRGTRFDPAPIGLYFARLWYAERLYPLIFTVSALQRARDALIRRPAGAR